jgi:hypothetical protein
MCTFIVHSARGFYPPVTLRRDAKLPQANEEYLAPVATMAVTWHINRERLLRAICAGRVRGEQRFGRWLVDVRDGEAAMALGTRGRTPQLTDAA